MTEVELTKEESQRRTAPQFNPFRSWVADELNRRKFEVPAQPVSPFVRLTSCQSDISKAQNYAYFSLGLHGFEPGDLNIFDLSYGAKDIVGYAVDLSTRKKRLISSDDLTEGAVPPVVTEHLSTNAVDSTTRHIAQIRDDNKLGVIGTSPTPGITNVSVVRRDLGAPMTVDVTYVCYNRSQLEFLRNHFMTVGRFVVVEWGNEFSNNRPEKTLDFGDIGITNTLTTALRRGRKYVFDQWVRPNHGNYDFIVGMIGNFRIGFDAKTNIYTCTTTIYSMGENMWGFDLHKTIVRKETNTATNDVSSFGDFFKLGSKFDKLVEQCVGLNQLVAVNNETWTKQEREANLAKNKEDLKTFSTNPEDYRFISWEFLTKYVIDHLFQSLKTEDHVKTEMMKSVKFFDDEESTDPEQQTWVCDNQWLLSTDPETMVIVKQSTPNIPSGFAGNGYFDELSTGHEWRGKLSRGVWINTGAVRACFLENNTFLNAMRALLTRMNNAAANYWNLRMFYDEDHAVYRIIDDGCVNIAADSMPPFYKFNIGGIGECLNIDFDSSFPPELVTQMALYAQFKSSQPPVQKELLEKYPSLGTTSTFMYSLNWTNLVDVVEAAYRAQLPGWKGNPISDTTLSPPPGTTNQSIRTTTRVTGAKFTNGTTGGATATSPNGAPPDQKVSSTVYLPVVDTMVVIPRHAGDTLNPFATPQRAYRNNNPGNLEYRDYFAKNYGAEPDKDEGRFSKFKTPEIGFAALCKQMEFDKANPKITNVTEFIHKYAPPFENSTAEYIKRFCHDMNIAPTSPIRGLDTVTMARTIARIESRTSLTNPPATVKNTDQSIANPDKTSSSTDPTPMNKSTGLSDQQTQEDNERKKAADLVKARFGDNFINLIEMAASSMRNRITRDGYLKYGQKKPNPYVCPFPTSANVTVTIQGISGLSVSDGFYVERLPFVFEQYGTFKIVAINEKITTQGWVTEIRGVFSLLFMEGEGLKHSAKTTAKLHP